MSGDRLFEVGPATRKERAAARARRQQLALFEPEAEQVDDGDEFVEAANLLADGWLDTEVSA